jgi:outer membrane biosynthesis protein TonB
LKFLETKHERDSAKITSLLILVFLLLLFIVGMPYMDPPEEFGVAVNFGTSEVGSGTIQPINPAAQATPQTKTEVTPTEINKTAEDVLTNDTQESIAINKQKQEELKKQQEAERIAREKQEQEIKKQQEEAEKKKKLDALIGGVTNSEGKDTGGEGNDNTDGDKGQLDGNPYASSYFGGSGPGKGGVGYGLNGRGTPTRKIYKQNCNEYGLVIVQIEVNRSGEVIKAEPGVKGTTNTHPCLLEPAKQIALSHKWPADSNAPARQIGFVSINFSVGQ